MGYSEENTPPHTHRSTINEEVQGHCINQGCWVAAESRPGREVQGVEVLTLIIVKHGFWRRETQKRGWSGETQYLWWSE